MAKYNNFDDFIKAHLNTAKDYDGVAGCQCVDLIKYYLKEVFDINAGAWGDAHAYYDSFESHSELTKNFTKIKNTPDFIPKKGDIAVWSSKLSMGGWGHIALCDGVGTTSYFYSYDNNWTGNHDPVTRIKHNYSNFLGVLRPKDQSKVTDKKVIEKKIIDISMYQKKVNYAKLAKEVDGAIIRVGYRGYGKEGTLCKDEMFDTHIKGIVKNKIPVGFYFFSQATTATEAKEEAKYVYNLVKKYDITYPIYIDVEYSGAENNSGRADKLSKTSRTNVVTNFCKQIESYGLNAGVYASESWFDNQIDYNKVSKYSVWVAKYGTNNGKAQTEPNLKEYDGWQFTSKFSLAAIDSKVDMSYFYKTFKKKDKEEKESSNENKKTYVTYYANDKEGVNYRKTPNGNLVGTYKYGTVISIEDKSDKKAGNYTWVKTKSGYWVAKSLLSKSKPSSIPDYKVNKDYTLKVDLKVRTGAGTKYSQKNRSQLTADGKKNAYNQTKAVFKKGTKITALEIKKIDSKNIWIKCPSGWLAAVCNGEIYIK